MSFKFSSIALLSLVCGFVAVLPGPALAGDLDGRYGIREGDENVNLDHVTTDNATGCEVYSLHCAGVFTVSSGRLVYDPATAQVWVDVKPIRNPLNLALQGKGQGTAGPGRTIVIYGLKLDGREKSLHFD